MLYWRSYAFSGQTLVPCVTGFVKNVIEEHRLKDKDYDTTDNNFVDFLWSLNGEDKLDEEDMISVPRV